MISATSDTVTVDEKGIYYTVFIDMVTAALTLGKTIPEATEIAIHGTQIIAEKKKNMTKMLRN